MRIAAKPIVSREYWMVESRWRYFYREEAVMDKVECVVVGAGPSGSACAIALARKGIETVLVERGQYAGAKNVASFILFADVLERIIPSYRDEAPLERIASDTGFFAPREGDFMELRAKSTDYYEKPTMSTAYRSEFDRWFAGKAHQRHLARK